MIIQKYLNLFDELMPVLKAISRQRNLVNVKDGNKVMPIEVSVEAIVELN